MIFFKNNKWKILISSILTLSPILFGLTVYDILPEQIATHWGIGGEADGWSSPTFVVFFIPILLFVFNTLCLCLTPVIDKKNLTQNQKAMNIVFWIMPVLSLYVNGIIYATAFGLELNLMAILCILLGVLFVAIGNYMPKISQNRSLGIKIKWTLANEANWNATHRFSGKIYFAVGCATLLCAFLPESFLPVILVSTMLVAAVIPVLYSYSFYKKQLRDGLATKEDYKLTISKTSKNAGILTVILVAAVLIFAGVMMFTGDIRVSYNDDSFTIEATYYNDLTINYSDIESITFDDDFNVGLRVYGFNSAKFDLGNYKNEEFGSYTIYAYKQCDACVVLKTDGKALALNGTDKEQTLAIYNEILARWEAQK